MRQETKQARNEKDQRNKEEVRERKLHFPATECDSYSAAAQEERRKGGGEEDKRRRGEKGKGERETEAAEGE